MLTGDVYGAVLGVCLILAGVIYRNLRSQVKGQAERMECIEKNYQEKFQEVKDELHCSEKKILAGIADLRVVVAGMGGKTDE